MSITVTRALASKPSGIETPDYNRNDLKIGVVHLGPGAFFRGHQAVYTDDAIILDQSPDRLNWGICGVSLRSSALRDGLRSQDGVYTLATLDQDVSYRLIGALKDLMVAPENPSAVIEKLADEDVKIVTLTITEKGYCLAPDGTLDPANPDIVHDTQNPVTPRSAIGYIVAALAGRKAKGLAPFTCISCDNLPDNGHKLKDAVIALATMHDKSLAQWITANVSFPRTMVDSITPATDEALIARLHAETGVDDARPIQREGFKQWVIENFDGPRPAWDLAGVVFTDDVGAFEHAKLKLLNGPHSTLAYLGPLAEHETVLDAIKDPAFENFIRSFTDHETIPGLKPPKGLNLTDYRDAILKRFHNPEIRHLLAQIAHDGTLKLPVRIIATIEQNLKENRSVDRHCLILAGWRAFVIQAAAAGKAIVDPRGDELARSDWSFEDSPETAATSFLAYSVLFSEKTAGNPALKTALQKAIKAMGKGTPENVRKALIDCS